MGSISISESAARHVASWNPFEAGGAATGAQYDVSSRVCRVGEYTPSRMVMVGVSTESVL